MTCPCANPECELVKKNYAMLQNSFEYLKLVNERNIGMLDKAAECGNENPEYDFALGRQQTGQLPTCGNVNCQNKHGNYIFLNNYLEDVIIEKNKAVAQRNFSINKNKEFHEHWTRWHSDNNAIVAQAVADKDNILAQYNILRAEYQQLHEMKTDPLCKDTVIIQLREEAAREHAYALERNATAFQANNAYLDMRANWEDEKEKTKQLVLELADCHKTMAKQRETIDVFRSAQPEELRTKRIGLCCTDYVCNLKSNTLAYDLNTARVELAKKNDSITDLGLERDKLTRDVTYWKGEYEKAVNGDCAEQREIKRMRTAPVEVVQIETKTRDLSAKLQGNLLLQLESLFATSNFCNTPLEETKLYDDFMMDQPEHQRLNLLEEMHKACHNNAPLHDREKKKYTFDTFGDPKNSSRVCKRSFSACLRALGGVFKRKGTKLYWTNIYLRHKPMFERTQLVGI